MLYLFRKLNYYLFCFVDLLTWTEEQLESIICLKEVQLSAVLSLRVCRNIAADPGKLL